MRSDLALGAATLAIAVGYYALAVAIPDTLLADEVGPGGLPTAYAVLLAALSLVLIIGSLTRARRPTPVEAPDVRADDRHAHARAAGMVVIGAIYLVAAPWLGYALALAAFLAATMCYQSGKVTRRAAFVALAGAAVFWLLFVQVLRVPHPPGIWPELF